jgi:hypothetical protein
MFMIDDVVWCWCETPPNRLLGTLYRCGGLWLGFTLAKRRARARWFCKWPLSLWKGSSSFFTLVWDQNSSLVPRWTRWWVALLRCGCMTWFIEGGRGWPYWEKFESPGGGGFHVKLWFTCRIGGGAWWWVCRGIVDLLRVFIVSLELCCRIPCWWGWSTSCYCYICGGSTNATVKDVVGSCILACIHWWSNVKFGRSILPPTAQAHLCQHKIPHALVGILKKKRKSFHDRIDAHVGVIDFLLIEKSVCQS